MTVRSWMAAVIFATLAGCGGDTGGGGGGTTADNIETTAVGNATVRKTYKPNVIRFPDSAAITATSPDVFQIATPPRGFTVSSVFTWMDRPYVVTSVKPVTGSAAIVVTTRDAGIDEVLSQLIVTGDLSMSDVDFTRLVVATPDDQNQLTATVNQAAAQHLSIPITRGPCTAKLEDVTQAASATLSCTVSKAVQSGFLISGTIGVKNISFQGIQLNLSSRQLVTKNAQATPFVTLAAELSGQSENKPGEIKDDILFAQARIPVPDTLGFVSVGVPFYLSYAVPLYNMGISVTANFPFSNGAFSFVGVLKDPTQSATTASVFTSQIKDAFIGIKSGVELALTSLPTPLASGISVAKGWPVHDDRLLAVGVFGTLGPYGSLLINIAPPKPVACFKWSLEPRLDTVVETTLSGDPIKALSSNAPLNLLPKYGIDGQSGCGNMTITASPNPILANSPVTLNALVEANPGTLPTGTVAFVTSAGDTLCVARIDSLGAASCAAVVETDVVITGKYSGDDNYPAVQSSPLTLNVDAVHISDGQCVGHTYDLQGVATGEVGMAVVATSGFFGGAVTMHCDQWTIPVQLAPPNPIQPVPRLACERGPNDPATTTWTAHITSAPIAPFPVVAHLLFPGIVDSRALDSRGDVVDSNTFQCK
ncbi:Ig-like domain-containing protein [Caballeronia sp. GaOx3]|uniref:Ig-like domain-containing protein n=1 Tax=Caballeronia sp. GaOx3 TaxID=2921740 RepID=UPI002027914B|nr:Ig-like domain-containing protein [Caballeronia sp. GaOx3]